MPNDQRQSKTTAREARFRAWRLLGYGPDEANRRADMAGIEVSAGWAPLVFADKEGVAAFCREADREAATHG